MADEKQDKANGLTVEDPVDQRYIDKLEELRTSWLALADRNARLELEKVQNLAALKRIGMEETRIFEAILIERGLPPDTPIEVDGATKRVKVQET